MLSPGIRQVTHALLTRPPLTYVSLGFNISPFDLHVLSTPPAFILSQDQTLTIMVSYSRVRIMEYGRSAVLAHADGLFPWSIDGTNPMKQALSLWMDLARTRTDLNLSCQSFLWHYCLFGMSVSRLSSELFSFLEFFRVALLFVCQGTILSESKNLTLNKS